MRPQVYFALQLGFMLPFSPDILADDSSPSIDYARVAETLSARLDVQDGEKVLLVAAPGRFDALVPLLRESFEQRGAEFLGVWPVSGEPPDAWATEFTADIAATADDDLPPKLAAVDASIMMPGANTSHAVYAAIQEVLRGGRGRTIHFHWAGAYGVDGILLPDSAHIDRVYERALLETDYEALSRRQQQFESAMRNGRVRVTTPLGTDISFEIRDRPVNRQDGDASPDKASRANVLIDREIELPAGAIRVAPVEETVEGRVVFPPSVWNDERVIDLAIEFERGVATRITASSGIDAVRAEMNSAGRAARAFREFALGFNPLLTVRGEPDVWIPYYGYGAGVVRLSLGDNSELGGKVGGGYVRWNFFVDATVTIGDTIWVQDGRLIPWPRPAPAR